MIAVLSIASLFAVNVFQIGTAAAVQVGFAFNSQYPPVAYYEKDYIFALAKDTFIGAASSLKYTYNSTNNSGGDASVNEWLNFNAEELILSGTPPKVDQDTPAEFIISATDEDGNTAEDKCTILIKAQNSKVPTVGPETAITDTLSSAGNLSNGTSVVIRPGNSFSIAFSASVFAQVTQPASYLGLSVDHSPLPVWIKFDASSLTFSGEAPSMNSQVAPAQQFGVALILSQDEGYMNQQIGFSIVVGAHQFSTNVTQDQLNLTWASTSSTRASHLHVTATGASTTATASATGTYKLPLDSMTLDGKTVVRSNISKITANLTDWMEMDTANFSLVMSAPANADSTNILITIYDTYDDYVQYILNVRLPERKQSVQNYSTQTTMSITTMNISSTTSSVSRSASSSGVANAAIRAQKDKDSTNKRTTAIACGTVIPVVVICALILLFCCWRRRKQKEDEVFGDAQATKRNTEVGHAGKASRRSNSTTTISYPLPEKMYEYMPPMMHVRPTTSYYSSDETRTPASFTDSPQRASTLNFMKLDDLDGEEIAENANLGQNNNSTNPGSSINNNNNNFNSNNNTPTSNNYTVVPMARTTTGPTGTTSEPAYQPRNSWRQTCGSGERWQEHQQLDSMASIPPQDCVTLKKVDSRQPGPNTAPPTHSAKASDDSGNIKSIGTHSTASSYYDDDGRDDIIHEDERSEIDRRAYPTQGQAFL